MKNNTLHYEYKEPIERQARMTDQRRKITCMSMRCTSIAGAREIINKRNTRNLKNVIFTDGRGTEHKLRMLKMRVISPILKI